MSEQDETMLNLFEDLDAIIASTDLSKVTAESTGFEELPEGYYLCEVESAKLTTSKSSKQPMVSFQFKVIEDGKYIDDDGNTVTVPHTKNRKIFKHYVIKDSESYKRFVADALKFEKEDGEPLLEKEMLLSSQLIEECLNVLIGMRIYVQCSVTENKNGEESRWYSLKSWDVISNLEI